VSTWKEYESSSTASAPCSRIDPWAPFRLDIPRPSTSSTRTVSSMD
jgi:hypothetical protein